MCYNEANMGRWLRALHRVTLDLEVPVEGIGFTNLSKTQFKLRAPLPT